MSSRSGTFGERPVHGGPIPCMPWMLLIAGVFSSAIGRAEDLEKSKASAPPGLAVISSDRGGAYFAAKALKQKYESLLVEVQELQEDIREDRVDETEAQSRIARLQDEVQKTLHQIVTQQIYVTAANVQKRTESQTFELSEDGCLYVEAEKIHIVGWDEPRVKCVLEKTVLGADDDPAVEEFDGIRAEYRRMPGAELLHLPGAEAFARLEAEKVVEWQPKWLARYRAAARCDPELLEGLDPKVLAILNRSDEPGDETALFQRLSFDDLVGKQVDVVRLKGLTHQEGNRWVSYEMMSKGGEGVSGSYLRRRASLTVFVPACEIVGVVGGGEGLEVESLDASLEISGFGGSPRPGPVYRVSDLGGRLRVRRFPLHVAENIRGDVSVELTTTWSGRGISGSSRRSGKPLVPFTYSNIQGDFRGWFTRADLRIEDVGGIVDVRNDFGDTVFATRTRLPRAAHRIVSEAGHVEVRFGPDALEEVMVMAWSECGRVRIPESLGTRDFHYISGNPEAAIYRSWVVYSIQPGRPEQLAASPGHFPREHRSRADDALKGRERSPGLDVVSRGGSVKIVFVD